jgi:hypothetical protein
LEGQTVSLLVPEPWHSSFVAELQNQSDQMEKSWQTLRKKDLTLISVIRQTKLSDDEEVEMVLISSAAIRPVMKLNKIESEKIITSANAAFQLMTGYSTFPLKLDEICHCISDDRYLLTTAYHQEEIQVVLRLVEFEGSESEPDFYGKFDFACRCKVLLEAQAVKVVDDSNDFLFCYFFFPRRIHQSSSEREGCDSTAVSDQSHHCVTEADRTWRLGKSVFRGTNRGRKRTSISGSEGMCQKSVRDAATSGTDGL